MGGSGPILHGVSGAATHVLLRSAADIARPRHLAEMIQDAVKEASTTGLDGTSIPGRSAAVASALAAAQGPSTSSASAGEAAAPGRDSGTPGESALVEERSAVALALRLPASRNGRFTRSRSRKATARRPPRAEARREQRRRRPSRCDKSPASTGPSQATESKHSPSGSSSDPSGMDLTKRSRSSTSISDSGSDHGALSRRRRARAAHKRPQRALVQEALRTLRQEQRKDTVVDPRFKVLLSPARYRLAQRGVRLHLPRGNSIRGIRADAKALMHTSRQFAGGTPLGLVTFLGNFQTACDGSCLNEGMSVTLLQ